MCYGQLLCFINEICGNGLSSVLYCINQDENETESNVEALVPETPPAEPVGLVGR